MAASKDKACLNCRAIYIGEKCPICGETPANDSFKGRVHVFNHESSQIANKLKIYNNGEFAVKTK